MKDLNMLEKRFGTERYIKHSHGVENYYWNKDGLQEENVRECIIRIGAESDECSSDPSSAESFSENDDD